MPRYIDADKFEVFCYEKTDGRENTFDDGARFVLEKIDEAPTEDVAPVVHAHWIKSNCFVSSDMLLDTNEYYVCSLCGQKLRSKHNYCPNCGAKMDERTD